MTLVADFNSSVNVPFQRMRQLLLEQGIQEGVIGANDLKVAQRGAGANMSVDVPAGAAWVQIDTGTRNGLGHVYNDATANVVVSASSGTNPRIDQIILRWNDTSIPTGSGNVPTLEVLTGTATAGATLDNRTGATALPNDCMRLADILVPTSSTSVTTANIRDRRPWARGALYPMVRVTTSPATASGTLSAVDTALLQVRVECSGVPLRLSASAIGSNNTAGDGLATGVIMDGAALFQDIGFLTSVAANAVGFVGFSQPYTPSAGSHLFALGFRAVTGGTATLSATSTLPLAFLVEEIVRPSATNGLT